MSNAWYNTLELFVYQVLSSLAGFLGWPFFYWHLRSRGRGESFLPRLGLKLPPELPPPGSPRIWIHGVSVGEVLSALPLVQELKRLLPQASLTVTTGTETGQAVARRHFLPLGVQVCYYPLDLPWAVRRYLNYLRPDVYISLDSEIWPNFLSSAHKKGVRLALLNARLSDRSFTRLLKYKRQLYDIINLYDVFAAGSSQDYERLGALGLPAHKLHLTGNLKIDRLLQQWEEEKGSGGRVREMISLPSPP
ncbi:MAG: glycosyltransferase N-terminal domain-containing protein, partial [Thermodesulfobacteriota bacterium]